MADLRAAKERTGGQKDDLEAELARVESEISQKEHALEQLIPKWEEHKATEAEEKRRCVVKIIGSPIDNPDDRILDLTRYAVNLKCFIPSKQE